MKTAIYHETTRTSLDRKVAGVEYVCLPDIYIRSCRLRNRNPRTLRREKEVRRQLRINADRAFIARCNLKASPHLGFAVSEYIDRAIPRHKANTDHTPCRSGLSILGRRMPDKLVFSPFAPLRSCFDLFGCKQCSSRDLTFQGGMARLGELLPPRWVHVGPPTMPPCF